MHILMPHKKKKNGCHKTKLTKISNFLLKNLV